MKTTIRLKGGKGSGNFGHAGRKGEVGGSTSETQNLRSKMNANDRLSAVRGQMRHLGIDPMTVSYDVFEKVCDDFLGRTRNDQWYMNASSATWYKFYQMFTKWQLDNSHHFTTFNRR